MTARDVSERLHDARAALVLVRRAHLQIDAETLGRSAETSRTRALDPSAHGRPHGQEESDFAATQTIGTRIQSGTIALPLDAVAHEGQAIEESSEGVGRRRWRRAVVALLAVLLVGAGAWWWQEMGPGAYTTVPDVRGEPREQAVTTLTAAGLGSVVTEAYDDEVPAGLVVRTEPGAGGAVLEDGEVEVVVSLGVLMLEVPQTAGRPEAEAVALLREAGFGVDDIERPYHQEVPKGTVVSTTPGAGEVVPHHQLITLTVSNGREPVTIPSVVGASRETAEAELSSRGLVPEVTTDYSDDVPEGAVIAQQPGPGAALRGDTVSVTVSLGPPLVTVPEVVGKQVGEAQGLLREAGFEVRVQRVLGGFFGTVRSSDPPAGRQAPRGSTVTLTVV